MLQPSQGRSAETTCVRLGVPAYLKDLARQNENKGHTLKTIVKICSLKSRAEPSRFGGDDIPKDSTARVGSTETKMYWRMDDKRVELTAGSKQSCWK